MNHLRPDANLLFDYELEKITLPVLRYAVTSARFAYQSHRFPFHGIQIYFSLCIRRIRVLVRMPFPLRAVFNAPHQPVYGLSGKNLAVMGRQHSPPPSWTMRVISRIFLSKSPTVFGLVSISPAVSSPTAALSLSRSTHPSSLEGMLTTL